MNSALGTQIGGEHYKQFAIQPAEFATRNGLLFLEGCVIKRVCRHSRGGKGRQDIEKAIHELQLLLDLVYPQTGILQEQWVDWDCRAPGAENGPVINTDVWRVTQVKLRSGIMQSLPGFYLNPWWGAMQTNTNYEVVAYRLTPVADLA